MRRATAGFLLLAMLLMIFGPVAFAASLPVPAAHCSRQPLAAKPAHHLCHAMAEARASFSAETSGVVFQKAGCCTNHECCRPLVRSQWARFSPAIIRLGTELSIASPVEPASSIHPASVLAYRPVRAPPRF